MPEKKRRATDQQQLDRIRRLCEEADRIHEITQSLANRATDPQRAVENEAPTGAENGDSDSRRLYPAARGDRYTAARPERLPRRGQHSV